MTKTNIKEIEAVFLKEINYMVSLLSVLKGQEIHAIKMNKIENIKNTLIRMIELLNNSNWADALEKTLKHIEIKPSNAGVIPGMYGGMGSLNDVILYKDGKPLISENNEFSLLRSQLYELCHEK